MEEQKKTSGLGVAAFICSLLGCTSVIGLILGIISVATAKKNNTKTGLAIAAIIISVLWMLGSFFIFGVVGLASDSTGDTNVSDTVTTEVASDDNENKEDSSEVNEADNSDTEAQDVSADNRFSVGDVVDIGDMKISYLSCDVYTDYNQFLPPKDGYVIYRMEFEVENTSDSDQYISIYEFECFADDYAMDAHYEDDDLSATLSAGKKAKGAVYFEIPEDAQSADLEYETNFWTQNKVIFVIK